MKKQNILYDVYLFPVVDKTTEEIEKDADELFKLAEKNLSNKVEDYNYDAREDGQEECWTGYINWGNYPDSYTDFMCIQIETNIFERRYLVPIDAGEDVAEFFHPFTGYYWSGVIKDYKVEVHWNYTEIDDVDEITPEIQDVFDVIGVRSFENFYTEENGLVESGIQDFYTGKRFYFDD